MNDERFDMKVDRFSMTVSNVEKIVFPGDGITKGDIINYYYSIAPVMLPLVKNRLISMQRYPFDIEHDGFYQKNAGEYFPSWVALKSLQNSDGEVVKYVIIDKRSTLVYLANQGCITFHIWLSKVTALEYPDRMIFDLDPSGDTFDFSKVRQTALKIKALLEELSLIPFVMTTGSRGLHVVVPIKPIINFDGVRSLSRSIAQHLVNIDPKNLTLELRKNKRGKKIFIDYLRNGYGATGVAPYSLRARPHAPVATPLDWQEINDVHLRSDRYTLFTVFDRLNKHGDPWKDIAKSARSLKRAIKHFQY